MLVYTGGSASLVQQKHKEADAAKSYFHDLGFDDSRIIFERDARNTYENAVLSKNKVKPDTKKQWILITSAYHMPMIQGAFCKLGWNIYPYPVDHITRRSDIFRVSFSILGNLNELELAVYEWLVLFVYYNSRKRSSIFPDRCE